LDEMNEQNECCFIGLDSFGNPLPKVQWKNIKYFIVNNGNPRFQLFCVISC
jgi:hypothetical protein